MILPDGAIDRTGEAQGTIGKGGKRLWLYPKEISGRHTRRRTTVAWVLLFVYLGFPWLSWNGEPLLRLDVFGRKLILASHYFWAQDIALFLPAVLGSVVLVFLVTARFGRIWCGWACPQTVFLQFLFYPAEKLVEGRASVRRERDRKPFTPDWIWRKTAKHAIFVALSLLIANTALAYFWGMDNLVYAVRHPSSQNAAGLLFVGIFGAVFYWVFAFFREQACVMVCPYARFQSVLVDERTSVVAYDQGRGEPRGRGNRGVREDLGSCVDCNQCVLVCPTGIDIRDGNQLECLGCMRCMDACDRTMEARGFPPNLVKYASLTELEGKRLPKVTGRLVAYGALTVLLFAATLAMLAGRGPLGIDVTRQGSTPYEMIAGSTVKNSYTLHIRNRKGSRAGLSLKVHVPGHADVAVSTNWDTRALAVSGAQLVALPLEITLPAGLFRMGRLDATLVISVDGVSESLPLVLAGPWRNNG